MAKLGRTLKVISRSFQILLLVTTVVLWVRSYFVHDFIGVQQVWISPDGNMAAFRRGLFSTDGRICYASGTNDVLMTDVALTEKVSAERGKSRVGTSSGDFGYWTGERDEWFMLGFGTNGYPDGWYYVISVPHLLVAAFLGVFPVIHALRQSFKWNVRPTSVIATYASLAIAGWIGVATNGALIGIGGVLAAAGGILLLVIIAVEKVALRKHPDGMCASCGYDLRATPYRCPECGTVPSSTLRRGD